MAKKGKKTPRKSSTPLDMMGEALTRLGEHFIGLWCFRTVSKKGKLEPRRFCVTMHFNGAYFDTDPQPQPLAALNEAHKRLCLMERDPRPEEEAG